jgi:hypothetical protein
MADSLRFDTGSTEFSEVQDDFFARAEADISVPIRVIKPFTVIKDDTRTNTLITEERYEIADIEDACERDRIGLTTNFHRSFPYPDNEKFALQTIVMGSLEHEIEVLYPNEIVRDPDFQSFASPYLEYSARIHAEGKRLKFNTRVTPFREVVDHDGIERYYKDARRLYDRRHNRFKVHGYDKLPATGGYGEDFIPAALLLAALTTVIVSGLIYG